MVKGSNWTQYGRGSAQLPGASPGLFLMVSWEKKIKTIQSKQPALNVSEAREDVSGPRFFYVYRHNIPSALSEPDCSLHM